MKNSKKEVKYHCTYVKEGVDEIFHYHSKRIYKVRNFIRVNRKNILSCWKHTLTKNKSLTQRIYRSITKNEPQDYYNNSIGA